MQIKFVWPSRCAELVAWYIRRGAATLSVTALLRFSVELAKGATNNADSAKTIPFINVSFNEVK
jgi:hypothetical protein